MSANCFVFKKRTSEIISVTVNKIIGKILVEKVNSLFVVHNEVEEKMTVEEIFDAKKFSDFRAVSYVSSPKFFAETVKDFQSVIFILGIDNVDNLIEVLTARREILAKVVK